MYLKKCGIFIFVILASILLTEAVLNFNDEDFFGYTADRYDWSKHPCHRNCTDDGESKVCEYVFVLEQLSSMGKACYDCPFNKADCFRPHCVPTDGVHRSIYLANRQLPGPTIEVCLNDVIAVEVRNLMISESTTIHWHGIKQVGTPYMDGVPFVTQCPILPGDRFKYIFNANISGTYFWHSHIGFQRAGGLFGALIIHDPPNKNVQNNLYDYDDHHMVINDWMNVGGGAAFIKEYEYKTDVVPQTILINGLGRYKKFKWENGSTTYVPSTIFKVEKDKRYRFRLINAGIDDCPIEMSIDNHTMLVISLDSCDIEPVEVDAITAWSGERIDFVLNANQNPENYWIRYRGYGLCEPLSKMDTGVYQVAILRYDSAPDEDPMSPTGYDLPKYSNETRVLNPFNKGTEAPHRVDISIPLLNSLAPNDATVTDPVDQQVFIEFDFYRIDNYDFHRRNLYGYYQEPPDRRMGTFQLNHISLKLPPFPLLSEWELLKPDSLCNASYVPGGLDCVKEDCACTHVIQTKLNSVVEVVFIDQGIFGAMNHPLHLHGHFFRVISTVHLDGIVTIDRFKRLEKEGKVIRRLNRAPLKDTMKSPGGGYTIVRFYANNPGYWFFHCHFEEHTNIGMALIFKIGDHEDFVPKPKNFPKCGNYV